MEIFLIVYILGVIAAMILFWHTVPSNVVTVNDLTLIIIGSLLSWISFIVGLTSTYGNIIIYRKKSHIK